MASHTFTLYIGIFPAGFRPLTAGKSIFMVSLGGDGDRERGRFHPGRYRAAIPGTEFSKIPFRAILAKSLLLSPA
jgi:hypothetical protein